MSLVNFKQGTLVNYKKITTPDTNTLYFVTDEGLLYLGSKLIAATSIAQKVENSAPVTGVYTITYIDSTNTPQSIDVVTSAQISSLISDAISTAIGNLDGTATIVSESNDVVTLTTSVTETDGVISAGSSTITLGNAAKKTVLSGSIETAVAAHEADSSETTINNLTTAAQVSDYVDTKLTGIVGAMVYRGTIGSQESGATVQTLPADAAQGDVYVVKTAGTYAEKACEVGDMIIYNGDTWDIVNGENQVTNSAATLSLGATNATTIATVDGTDITLKIGTLTVSDTGSGNVVSGVLVSGDTMTLTRTDVIASITGETAISGGNSNLVAVTATTSSNATTLASSVKTQTLASATSSADGLATAYDIQQNAAANCVLANYTTVTGGTVTTSDTINAAINKLETVLVWGSF
jgi:hypothetical protein